MNERIKELEKQAWDCVDQTWDWANPDNPSKVTLFKTKFAELIVQECLEQIEKNFVGAIGTHASAHNSAVLKCKKSIQEHFGVE